MRRRLLAAAAVSVLLLACAAPAFADATCNEVPGGLPAGTAASRAQLQANPDRPTFDVGLGRDSSTNDDITLPPRRARQLGLSDRDVTAVLTGFPRKGSERFGGTVRVGAAPGATGRTVSIAACVKRTKTLGAGAYRGVVTVYGPRLEGFDYPIVVTEKWPAWIPIVILAGSILVFLVAAAVSGSLTFGLERRQRIATALGVLLAVAAAALTYWNVYAKNDTWGDDPGAQMLALAVAAFTAAVGGLAAAERMLRPKGGGEKEAEEEREPVGEVA